MAERRAGDDMSEPERGEPTLDDVMRAEMWLRAIEFDAEMWTLLSPEQQQMVRDRIEWALPGKDA